MGDPQHRHPGKSAARKHAPDAHPSPGCPAPAGAIAGPTLCDLAHIRTAGLPRPLRPMLCSAVLLCSCCGKLKCCALVTEFRPRHRPNLAALGQILVKASDTLSQASSESQLLEQVCDKSGHLCGNFGELVGFAGGVTFPAAWRPIFPRLSGNSTICHHGALASHDLDRSGRWDSAELGQNLVGVGLLAQVVQVRPKSDTFRRKFGEFGQRVADLGQSPRISMHICQH